jgi:hypothetical protein
MVMTKKEIRKKVENLPTINYIPISDESKEFIYTKTIEILKERKIFLKDVKSIVYHVGKFLEIGFHLKDSYFSEDLGRIR